ncbi:DUF6591 domain-containing protein [Desulfosporosinus youngiae]|uniref:Lipoprotein n=1 Tax=Desulfosporosinus youngiae DSM 17734 TaxID=768710 RepID=H5XWJ8_9FIRM|nr:DUF6591 domain-containing protein [Desulfosporosinus youngiae]EHQ90506.1 hypothetical protein DesyoDRAFT_3499 [Desulfosporosinus youngiae DSM 17734]
MKKVLIFILTVALAASLAGCKSPAEAATEKAAEKIFENTTGSKLDIEGDKVSVTGKDGSQLIVGENKWPTDKVGREIPAMACGRVAYVYNDDKSCNIILQEVRENDVEDYLAVIRAAGFSGDKAAYSDDINSIYLADNGQGINIQLGYNHEEEQLSLTAIKTQQ